MKNCIECNNSQNYSENLCRDCFENDVRREVRKNSVRLKSGEGTEVIWASGGDLNTSGYNFKGELA